MKQKARRLKTLGDISEIKLEGELADLARLLRAEKQLNDEIQSLDEKAYAMPSDSQALVCHINNSRWLRWRQKRKSQLNTQLAVLRAEKEGMLSTARKAFGRVQVIRSLGPVNT